MCTSPIGQYCSCVIQKKILQNCQLLGLASFYKKAFFEWWIFPAKKIFSDAIFGIDWPIFITNRELAFRRMCCQWMTSLTIRRACQPKRKIFNVFAFFFFGKKERRNWHLHALCIFVRRHENSQPRPNPQSCAFEMRASCRTDGFFFSVFTRFPMYSWANFQRNASTWASFTRHGQRLHRILRSNRF